MQESIDDSEEFSHDSMIMFLKDLDQITEGPVTELDIAYADGPSVTAISSEFGGVTSALEAANVEIE